MSRSYLLPLLLVMCSAITSGQNIDVVEVPGGLSGTGTTTRYWDCCKPTCAWAGNVDNGKPMVSCSNDGATAIDDNTQSGCESDGSAYVCSAQHGYAINDTFAIGFAAASFDGNVNLHMCCACVLFSFQGELAGKQMLVQITNTGTDDLHGNEFDISIPGGGVGYYEQGCTKQWGSGYEWGQQYGGVNSAEECYNIPQPLIEGCLFRFEFMRGVSNPDVSFVQVECPSQLTSISQCSL